MKVPRVRYHWLKKPWWWTKGHSRSGSSYFRRRFPLPLLSYLVGLHFLHLQGNHASFLVLEAFMLPPWYTELIPRKCSCNGLSPGSQIRVVSETVIHSLKLLSLEIHTKMQENSKTPNDTFLSGFPKELAVVVCLCHFALFQKFVEFAGNILQHHAF